MQNNGPGFQSISLSDVPNEISPRLISPGYSYLDEDETPVFEETYVCRYTDSPSEAMDRIIGIAASLCGEVKASDWIEKEKIVLGTIVYPAPTRTNA